MSDERTRLIREQQRDPTEEVTAVMVSRDTEKMEQPVHGALRVTGGVSDVLQRGAEMAERYEARIAEQARLLGIQGRRIQEALRCLAGVHDMRVNEARAWLEGDNDGRRDEA